MHIKAFEGNFPHEEVSIIQALCKSSLGRIRRVPHKLAGSSASLPSISKISSGIKASKESLRFHSYKIWIGNERNKLHCPPPLYRDEKCQKAPDNSWPPTFWKKKVFETLKDSSVHFLHFHGIFKNFGIDFVWKTSAMTMAIKLKALENYRGLSGQNSGNEWQIISSSSLS